MADATPAAPATTTGATEAPATETAAVETPATTAAPAEGQGAAAAEGEAPATEGATGEAEKPAVEPVKPKVEPVVSKGLALLTKREAEVRKRDEAVKAREAAIDAREAKLRAAAEDPEAALTAIGLTYDQITDYYIRGRQVTPEMKAVAESKKTRDALEKLEAAEAQRSQRHVQESVAAYKTRIEDFVSSDSNKERFEYINALGEQDMIYETINRHLGTTGSILGGDLQKAMELAAEKVEEYLSEEYAERLLTTKKFQNKIQPSREVRPTANQASKNPARTLSHSQAASVPPRADVKFTNPDDTIERLIKGGLRVFKSE